MTRRLQVLFLVALLGVLAAVGTAVGALLGTGAGVAYGLAVLAALVLLSARARRASASPALPEGRTCTCCTTSQHDPVRVV